MAIKYKINCLQGTNFCEWSNEDPATRQEIIDYFYGLYLSEFEEDEEDDRKYKKDFSLQFISSLWDVEFEKVK